MPVRRNMEWNTPRWFIIHKPNYSFPASLRKRPKVSDFVGAMSIEGPFLLKRDAEAKISADIHERSERLVREAAEIA